jgi:SAM-dependent methyltransferase
MGNHHYEILKGIVPDELIEKVRRSIPLDRLSELLHKDVRNTGEWHLHTGKYIQKLDLYLSEKLRMFGDLKLHDQESLRILDIGTGMGLFPWICRVENHYCESTYYDYFEFYKDAWETLGINTPFFFEVKCDQPWDLPMGNRYDVICAMRTVFDRYPHHWTVTNWLYFFKEADHHLNPGGQLLIKTNRSVDGIDPNNDLDPAMLRLLEPYFLEGYNSRTFLLSKDDIKGIVG